MYPFFPLPIPSSLAFCKVLQFVMGTKWFLLYSGHHISFRALSASPRECLRSVLHACCQALSLAWLTSHGSYHTFSVPRISLILEFLWESDCTTCGSLPPTSLPSGLVCKVHLPQLFFLGLNNVTLYGQTTFCSLIQLIGIWVSPSFRCYDWCCH